MNLETFLKTTEPLKLRAAAITYLNGEGDNEKLADQLEKNIDAEVQLVESHLSGLKRIIGPDLELPYFEKQEVWEDRVNKLVHSIEGGYEPLPLIVTDFWGDATLADGNHRHEALLRCGYKKYWVLSFLNCHDSEVE